VDSVMAVAHRLPVHARGFQEDCKVGLIEPSWG
jgi:hypothetical protein